MKFDIAQKRPTFKNCDTGIISKYIRTYSQEVVIYKCYEP